MEIQRIKLSKEDRQLLAVFVGEDPGTHIDFNWLMPVVEKIETMKFSVMVIGKYTRIQCPHPYKEFATDICETKIESVYKAVVEFIKWHNQLKP
jgi:hypothetical protein